MFPSYRFEDVLDEVLIRILENDGERNVTAAVTKIEPFFGSKESYKEIFNLRYGDVDCASLLYVAAAAEEGNLETVRQQKLNPQRLKILQRLIQEMRFDVRESFAVVLGVGDLHDQILCRGTKAELNNYYKELREYTPGLVLQKEVTIRLLSTYPNLRIEDVARMLAPGGNITDEEARTFSLGDNYPYQDFIPEMHRKYPKLNIALIDSINHPDYMQAIKVLRTVNDDMRQIFAMCDYEDNFHKIAKLTIVAAEMTLLENCMVAIMAYQAIHLDCREANEIDVIEQSKIPKYAHSFERAEQKMREEFTHPKSVYTSFRPEVKYLFDKLRDGLLTIDHLLFFSPSNIASLIKEADMLYSYDVEWRGNYPFISPQAMNAVLKAGANCDDLIAAEQKAAIGFNMVNYTELRDQNFLLSYIPGFNSTNSSVLTGALAVTSAMATQTISTEILLGIFTIIGVGVVAYRNADTIIENCSHLNLFGKRRRRAEVEMVQRGPNMNDSEHASLLIRTNKTPGYGS